MPLVPGSRLGPYEIVAPLGAGGMGEVYRARDTRLGREVALKVLPVEFSADPGRRSRFEQEARAAAALSHPNIVGVHDVGTADTVAWFVGELVAGETLADVIRRGPVPIRKLLDIAVQIADGMAAAHTARITHRDLKPANIMVTPEGRVKILDFGLARQASLPSGAPDETVTVAQTTPGMVLGTVQYMSPEQARGLPADHRSDQFSLGLILYEMAAGKRAFDRPEAVQIMSAILTEEAPPIDARVPEPLRWAIDRCLAKDPADRYDSSIDFHRDLRNIRDHLSGVSTMVPAAPVAAAVRAGRRRWPVIAGVATALVAAVAATLYLSGNQFPDQAAYRFTPFAFGAGGQSAPVWSPDGKAVAYAARPETETTAPSQVFVRYLDSPAPVQLTHIPERAQPMAWAPDGKRILFESERSPAGLWSVSTVGGEPEPFFPLVGDWAAAVSPDLAAVAWVGQGEDGMFAVWISTPPGAPRKKYLPDPVASKALFNGARVRFSPDGKSLLLFMKGDRGLDEVWLMPYPPSPSVPPRLVLPGLPSYGGTPHFCWMPDSRNIVLSYQSTAEAPAQLWLADTASGKRVALTSGTAMRSMMAVSPDGGKIVFTEASGNYDVVTVNLDHAAGRRLIATERDESMPAWATRQALLVYVTDRNGPQEIWLHGPGGERPLVTARDFPRDRTRWFSAPALSPEGDRVIYGRSDLQGRSQLWISSVSGGAQVPVTNDPTATEFGGSWSPDGAWFAYVATRAGKRELLRVKSTGQATPILIKSAGNSDEIPSWSPTGDSLLCGNNLVSPEGATIRAFGDHHTRNYVFSLDGKLLYGLRSEGDRELLFSVDVATGVERVIGDVGKDFAPGGDLHPGIRFSLAPDGKSFVYAAGTFTSNLWLMEGWATGARSWGLGGR